MPNKCALLILDGFAITPEKNGNAILSAKTPNICELFSSYPKTLLKASGQEAGLPFGEVGNSEVGHTNIGLGRIVLQDLPQIDKSFKENKIREKTAIVEALNSIQANRSNLHIIGLFSDGGVHCHINHILGLVDLFKDTPNLPKIFLHLISDGRDVDEKSIEKFVKNLEKILSDKICVGSLSGRYFAMDRDKNWDRIQKAYLAILGQGELKSVDVNDAIKSAYERSETDEYFSPTAIGEFSVDLKKDVFIFANYRSDRAIQLTRAFSDTVFNDFKRQNPATNFFMMTTYDDNLKAKPIFSNLDLNDKNSNPLTNPVAKIISEAGLTQYHIAETEKYAHVTYFFAGGEKEPFSGQQNKLYPSAKVKSHDLYPQMRAAEITKDLIANLSKNYNFIVANFANGDMVGHSGNFEAAVKTVEILDYCLGKLIPALIQTQYSIYLTADHGNCDQMINLENGKIDKEHSLNPVPFIKITPENKGRYISLNELAGTQPIGVLADIMACVLSELGIKPPEEMTGMDISQSLT